MKFLLKNGILTISVLIAATLLLIYCGNRYILTPDFFKRSGDPLSGLPGNGKMVYDNLQRSIYLSSALFIVIKLFTIVVILNIGLYLNDQHPSFWNIMKAAAIAEFVFLVPAAIKILTFREVFPAGTLLEWHKYYVLSALSIVQNAPADWYYLLQTLNLFEVVYWFVLAYGITKISALNYDKSLKIVITYYLPALLTWVIAITFITLIMFPSLG